MPKTPAVEFLFDVDNTLLDNDGVQADLKEHLEQAYGSVVRLYLQETLTFLLLTTEAAVALEPAAKKRKTT